QNHRGDLGRGVLLPLRHDRDVISIALHLVRHHLHFFRYFFVPAPLERLDRINRVLGIRNGLPLGHLPHQPLAGLGERHHRRRRPPTFLICDDLRFATFHDGYHGVGCPQVNTNNLAHVLAPPEPIEIATSPLYSTPLRLR